MELIDLSRELFHRTQVHPSHPPVAISVWGDHSEKKVAGDTVFTSMSLSLQMGDHSGTHVDAPLDAEDLLLDLAEQFERASPWGQSAPMAAAAM
jgi:kynurenine formamidase